MADLWKELIPGIMSTKVNYLLTKEDEDKYPAFMIVRALSYHLDCILFANQMNISYNLDNKLQYDFLMATIRPMKRGYQKWAQKKTMKTEEIEAVKRYYGLSDAKAVEAIRVLSTEELAKLVEISDLGGKD